MVSRNLQANYYPMPAAAFLETSQHRMTVLADHPHGVSAPDSGMLEIMLGMLLLWLINLK